MSYKSILIVDDSPTERRAISAALRGRGYRITTAEDGEEGLQKAKAEKPDLIVLDVVMPRSNGYQVCRKLKRMPETKHAKIIMLTSKDQDSDRAWGMRQGADAYMTKPFEPNNLVNTISSML